MGQYSSNTRQCEPPAFSRIGDGWEETTIQRNVRHPAAYDEFVDQDRVDAFIAEDLAVTEDDYEGWKSQQDLLDGYRCDRCEDEIAELVEQGDEDTAAEIDPVYTIEVTESERPLEYGGDAEKRVEQTVEAYCDRHRDDGQMIEYTNSWLE